MAFFERWGPTNSAFLWQIYTLRTLGYMSRVQSFR